MKVLNALLKHFVNAGGNLDHWLVATAIALLVSIGTASLVHGVEQHDSKIAAIQEEEMNRHAALEVRLFSIEKRLYDIENAKVAATAKRYTSDDAAKDKALIYACIKDKRDCP